MLRKKLAIFLCIFILGFVISFADFTFLKNVTKHLSNSKTVIDLHVQQTRVELHGNIEDNNKKDDQKSNLITTISTLPKQNNSDVSDKSKTVSLTNDTSTSNQIIKSNEAATKEKTDPKEEIKKKLELEKCPVNGVDLVGLMYVDQTVPEEKDLVNQLSIKNGGTVEVGGWWQPEDCIARSKVALIIPFRNRYKQLSLFLRHMHPLLQRQQLDYRIFVIDQDGTTPFNRASLFNVGYKEALKTYDYDCFIFTDVDLLPEDDRNNYGCVTSPRHMSVAVDKFNYRLPYETIFGGVGAFKKKDFEDINGFSNKFWGWGGEDDDLYNRIVARGKKLTRPPLSIGRYTMVKLHHFQSHGGNPERSSLLHGTVQRMTRDGLNSLVYKVVKRDEQPLVTIITVDIQKQDHMR